ncbi:hypothetical protein ACET3Z_014477 [Daucus carota]
MLSFVSAEENFFSVMVSFTLHRMIVRGTSSMKKLQTWRNHSMNVSLEMQHICAENMCGLHTTIRLLQCRAAISKDHVGYTYPRKVHMYLYQMMLKHENIFTLGITVAGIAQLGERQTEDLKVTCSIHVHRIYALCSVFYLIMLKPQTSVRFISIIMF